MLRRFLFVGLGGSGGKTLRYLRRDLLAWLQSVGWESDELPAGWQMLHIDSPTQQDGQEIREVDMLPASSYLGLVAPGLTFGAVAQKLGSVGGEAWKEQAGWKVDPTWLQVPITTGAGQYRAVGRTIGLTFASDINRALRAAANRLTSAEAAAELSEIHRMAYGSEAPAAADPVAVVVSSLAGGTGAGLLPDVCDLLRKLPGKWAGDSFGILYSSDVFKELSGDATAGVQPNTLAALCELMNGYWQTNNFPRASALFDSAGAPEPIARTGPAYPFLVGASNTKGVSFGNQRAVYAMMGRALKSWTVDPSVQAELIAYTLSNWNSSAQGNNVKADIVVRDHLPIFEALGFAEVSLGLDRFEEYSKQRLAREAAEWLHEGHLIQARANNPDDARPPAQIIEATARDQLLGVMQKIGLNERGESNQIIDSLIDQSAADELRVRLTGDLMGLASQGVKAISSQAWTERISALLPAAAEQYEHEYNNNVLRQSQHWAIDIPERTVKTINELITRFGLATAGRVVELIREELRAVGNELNEEADDFRRWAQDFRASVAGEFPSGGNIGPSHPAVANAIETGLWTLGNYRAEARRRSLARELMADFSSGFLEPLERAIGQADSQLTVDGFVGDGDSPPVVPDWASRAVPDSMIPPKNELLVIDTDDFPSIYHDLLSKSTAAKYEQEKSVEARRDVMGGAFLDDDYAGHKRVPRAIQLVGAWLPDPMVMVGGPDRQMAKFSTGFAPADLLSRSRAWLRRNGTAFERYLSSDLRSFLDDNDFVDPAEIGARRSKFRRALAAALDSAEPLVQIDPGLLALLHGEQTIPQRAVPGLIPLRDHPVEESVREILAAKLGAASSDVDKYFSSSGRITSVSISSTLGRAHDPMVFYSITNPIIAGWSAASQQSVQRVSFWSHRRSRPISEFIPASQEIILAMTRGWFTGLLLGKIDRSEMRIVRGDDIVKFPDPLISSFSTARDALPVVLESMGLAYAEVARTHSLEPLGAYLALRDLGIQQGLPDYRAAHLYNSLGETLSTWIRSGDGGVTVAQGMAERNIGADASSADRRQAVLKVLDENRLGYSKEIKEYEKAAERDSNQLGPIHGIWPGMSHLLIRALIELHTAVEQMSLQDEDEMM
jgi:hypothetical protein